MTFINDHHGAAAFLLKWIKSLGHKKEHPFIGRLYASYSKLLYEWNRLEEAEHCISQVLNMPPVARNLLQIYISASRIQQSLGKPLRATELLEQLKLQIDSPDYELFMRKIEAEQACLSVRQGSIQYGVEWLERCGMAHTDEVSLSRMAEHLALARVLAACGRPEEALHLLERMYHLLCKEDRLRDRIKVLILQSVTLHRIGQTEEALVQLETALRLAEPEGYIRSFIDEGPVMAELLSSYLHVQQGSRLRDTPSVSLAYVEQLLQALNVTPEEAVKPNRVRVHCFGRFKVLAGHSDGVEIKWRTSKAEELMAYLVHHRGEAVDRYRIMDSLWGDLDAVKAAAQLNTTVHYLRKNLSSKGIEGMIHHARGFYKIDANQMDCDYDAFDKLASASDPINTSNINVYEDIARIYKGGYMEGNDYRWAEQARSSLENEYVGILLQMHDHYMRKRDVPSAATVLKKALKCAPLNEDIHTKLIHVYVLANDRIAAMKQYDALRRTLQAEFGAEPGDTVKQLLNIK